MTLLLKLTENLRSYSKGHNLAHMQFHCAIKHECRDIAINSALKVSGLALSHYFPTLIWGSILDGVGSTFVATSLGALSSICLEILIPENDLPPVLSSLVVVMKYAIPLIVALGTCHLIYGSTLLTTAFITLYQLYTSFEIRAVLYPRSTL